MRHSTFNNSLKQTASIDNQNCLHYCWMQCYQWRLPHPVFSVYYFSNEFIILSDVSFETPCTNNLLKFHEDGAGNFNFRSAVLKLT